MEPSRITSHTEITDHVSGGLALLTTENRKPTIKAVSAAWLARVQEAENALWGLLIDTTILTATHAQLDQIGVLLVLARGEMSDAEYRAVLRAGALANRSHGTADEHIAVLDLVLGVGGYTFAESFPAGLFVTPAGELGALASGLREVLRRTRAGGVGLGLVDPPSVSAFAFAPGEDVTSDSTEGWSDTAGLTGGAWAGVIDV